MCNALPHLALLFVMLGSTVPGLAASSGAPRRVGVEANYPPFISAADASEPRGISVDILRKAAANQGLQLAFGAPTSLPQLLEGARTGQVDIVTSVASTPERSAYLEFTAPYLTLPAVVILRQGDRTHYSLDDLHGARVAVGLGYAVENFLKLNQPNLQLLTVADDRRALQALAEGKADAAVMDIGSARWLIANAPEHKKWKFRISSEVGYDYRLSFAVPKGKEALLQALEAGLHSIPPGERDAILRHHLDGLSSQTLHEAGALTWLVLPLLAALLYLGYHRRQLSGPTPPDPTRGDTHDNDTAS